MADEENKGRENKKEMNNTIFCDGDEFTKKEVEGTKFSKKGARGVRARLV